MGGHWVSMAVLSPESGAAWAAITDPPLPSPASCTKSGYKGVAHNATSKAHPFVAKTPLGTSTSRSHHLPQPFQKYPPGARPFTLPDRLADNLVM